MHAIDNLKLPRIGGMAPEATTAFWAYDKAALAGGAISKKFKELMAIAVALTTQCAYCIELHRQGASRPVQPGGNWPKRFTSPLLFAPVPP